MKLAVITGGTKGIGKAIVHHFAKHGFAIATCARSRQDLESLREAITAEYGVPFYSLPTNLAQKAETKAFGAFVQTLSLPVAVLVNNAGIYASGKFLEEDEQNFEQLWQVNVASVYYLTRLLAPAMVAQSEGHIFNICSVRSQLALVDNTSYCASKFALYGMTKVLRQELQPTGVRVTAVLPGATYSHSWEGVDISPERLMRAEDVAEAIYGAYCLSPQAVVEELTIRPQLGDL